MCDILLILILPKLLALSLLSGGALMDRKP